MSGASQLPCTVCLNSLTLSYHGAVGPGCAHRMYGRIGTMIHVGLPMAAARCATDVQDEMTRSHVSMAAFVSSHVRSHGWNRCMGEYASR